MSDETPRNGLHTVLEEMRPTDAPPPEPQAEQLSMLSNPLPGAQEDSEAPEGPRNKEPVKAGRPPGSRNKRTEAWTDYILDRYQSPLILLARLVTMKTEEVRKEFACTALEAIRLQKDAAKELAPYLHQKQPLALQSEGTAPINLIIGSLEAEGGVMTTNGPGLTLEGTVIQPDDDQEDDADGVS